MPTKYARSPSSELSSYSSHHSLKEKRKQRSLYLPKELHKKNLLLIENISSNITIPHLMEILQEFKPLKEGMALIRPSRLFERKKFAVIELQSRSSLNDAWLHVDGANLDGEQVMCVELLKRN